MGDESPTGGGGAKAAEELPKLAGFGGHCQVSRVDGSKVGTAFNYHPGGSVDRRTNIYYAQTTDFGRPGRPSTAVG